MKEVKSAVIFLFVSILLSGCVTVSMPQYLKAQNPYQKQFAATYDETLAATAKVLEKLGWEITKQENPLVFEQETASMDITKKQVLLFTKIKQKALFLASRYTTLNVIVKENSGSTDVEVRYFSIFSTAFKNFETYQNDKSVNRILHDIEAELSGQ